MSRRNIRVKTALAWRRRELTGRYRRGNAGVTVSAPGTCLSPPPSQFRLNWAYTYSGTVYQASLLLPIAGMGCSWFNSGTAANGRFYFAQVNLIGGVWRAEIEDHAVPNPYPTFQFESPFGLRPDGQTYPFNTVNANGANGLLVTADFGA